MFPRFAASLRLRDATTYDSARARSRLNVGSVAAMTGSEHHTEDAPGELDEVPDLHEPDSGIHEPDSDQKSTPDAQADQASGSAAASHLVRAVRSALGVIVVLITFASILIYAMPDSPIKENVPSWIYSTGDAITLNQNWALFAPDPPTTDVKLDVVVTGADGTVTVESLPSGPAWLPTARSERWRKVRERVTPTSASERWPELMSWSLRQLQADGRNPQRIELRRRWTDRDADDPNDEGTEQTFVFARLEVPTDDYVVLDPDAPGAVKDQPADAAPDGRVEKTDQ